jgi:hypothetical protein
MRILVLAMVALFVLGTAATATESLLNGNMESWTGTATADNWTFYKKGTSTTDQLSKAFQGSTSTLAAPSPKYKSAVQSQAVDVIYKSLAWSHAGVYQQVPTVANHTYNISAWIAATNYGWTPVVTNLKEGWLGVENGALTVPTWTLFTGAVNTNWSGDTSATCSDGTWRQQTISFTATGTSITVFLDGYHATATNNSTKNMRVHFDDASVVDTYVPEPGTLIALLSGAIGLVGYGVRRRK